MEELEQTEEASIDYTNHEDRETSGYDGLYKLRKPKNVREPSKCGKPRYLWEPSKLHNPNKPSKLRTEATGKT